MQRQPDCDQASRHRYRLFSVTIRGTTRAEETLGTSGTSQRIITSRTSIPVLHSRPDVFQVPLQAAAVVYIEVLIGHRIRVFHAGHLFDGGEQLLEPVLTVVHHDDALASVVARPPQKV